MLTPEMVFKLVSNPRPGAPDITLAGDEWRVLALVNGHNTLATICERARLVPERVVEILELLLWQGLVELAEQIETRRAASSETAADHATGPLSAGEATKLPVHAFLGPKLCRRQALAALGHQLVIELLKYQLVLRGLLAAGAPGGTPQRMARIAEQAKTIDGGCAYLLGESGPIARRLGLVQTDERGKEGADGDVDWVVRTPLEDLAGAVLAWYRQQVEDLALLYGQILAEGGAIFAGGQQATSARPAATREQGELRALRRLGDTPACTAAAARSHLLDQLPALERRLRDLILQPPEQEDSRPGPAA